MYIQAENNLSILSIEINGIYSGLEKINISNCLDLVSGRVAQVIIVTPSGVISSSQYLKEIRSSVSLDVEPSSCYNSSFINTIGTESPCLGMLIVNRSMLDNAIDNNPISFGVDYYITFGSTNYTFGDSTYNVFTGQITDMGCLFCSESFNSDINYWDVSNVTDMSRMFMHSTFGGNMPFNQPLNEWDVSSVRNMSEMFYHSVFSDPSPFNQNISLWDVSSVTDMREMFHEATSFDQPLYWATGSVTDMSGMFRFASSMNSSLPFLTTSVENMDSMFNGATDFNQDISNWCTDNFPIEPTNFDNGAGIESRPEFQPDWGNNDCS